MPANSRGFTLIELIVGIVALSAALMVLTGILIPQAERSTNPWFQVRSAELAQSILNEVGARSFDENSATTGESYRCDEVGAPNPCIATLPDCPTGSSGPYAWAEESSRDLYDDVDDFHCLTAKGNEITNVENTSLEEVYREFTVNIYVSYAGADLGLGDRLAKKITVVVTPPNGDAIDYSSYKVNY